MNKLPRLICLLIALVVVAYFASFRSQRTTAQAASFTISGTVTDSNGQGLAGVTMVLLSDVAGTQITFTDQSGNYVLNYAGGVSRDRRVSHPG